MSKPSSQKTTPSKPKIAAVSPRKSLLPIPSDLKGRHAGAFVEICETVAMQSGLAPSDAPVIAAIVRSQRRAEIFDGKAADALIDGNNKDALAFAAQSERAAGSARTGLAALKALPNDRSAKISRATQAQTVAGTSDKWADLLESDQ